MTITRAPSKISKSVQEVSNLSFDEDFNISAIENLVYNPITGEIERMVQPGDATAAKQDEIVAELGKKADKSTTPIVYNLTLANANTEYSQELPAHTKELRFRCRTLYDVRYAWVAGKVATPTTPYLTLPAGCDYWSDRNDLSSRTLYFASSTAGVVIEMEVFT